MSHHHHATHEHSECLEGCLVIFCHPLAIWVHQGECTSHVLVNWLLGLISFGILGIVHAFWFCFVRPDDCVLTRCHDHNTVIIVDQQRQPSANPVHCDRPQVIVPAQQNQMHPTSSHDNYDNPPPAYNESAYSKRRDDCCE